MGFIIDVGFATPGTATLVPDVADTVHERARRRSLLTGRNGPSRNVLRIAPLVCVSLADVNIRKHWNRVSANLGLPSMPWHNLRHSAATIMPAQGVPIEVVSRVFGHASIRITADIYGHVSPETNRQAADAMSKALR